MPIYLANDSYEGFLQTTYNPGESVFALDNLPLNVPTIVVSAPGTEYEAVFTVTGKTINALTGVARIRGYNGVLVEGTAITCLNNEEFINQYRTYLGIDWKGDWDNATAYAIQDGVAYNNTSYVAIQAGTNHLPTDTNYWQVVGVPGIQGEPGAVDTETLTDAILIEDATNTNDYVGDISDSPISYFTGMLIYLKATNANTGASTINVNSLGVKSIKKNVSEVLEADEIKAGQIIPLSYDGTNFQIVGGGGSATGATRIIRELVNETPNGAIVDFTIDSEPVAGTEEVFLNGILQNISGANDYSISGNTITFTSAPETGSIILVNYSTTSVFEPNANADTVDGYHLTDILSLLHPVGSIYMTVDSTNPATIFGFGTWSAWGAGRVPVGVNTGDSNFNTVEKTGGVSTVTLTSAQSGIVAHNHTQNSHRHWISSAQRDDANNTGCMSNGQNYGIVADAGSYSADDPNYPYGRNSAYTTATNNANTAANAAESHSNLQPYITCYMWKRTA